jgi:membrane protease YdiL (CAAX protease family)
VRKSPRVSQYLISGALIGALFLWLALALLVGINPDLSWVPNNFGLFFAVCFLSPVLEEYVFRGLVYDYVERRSQWVWPANSVLKISISNLVSSFLFVMLHGILRGSSAALLVIVPSLYLGMLRRETSGLGPCILVHGFWNLGWFSLFPPMTS